MDKIKDLQKLQTRLLDPAAVVEDSALAENEVRVVVTKQIPDSHGTIFECDGMELSRMSNGGNAVFLGHNDRLSSDNLSIARAVDFKREVDQHGVPLISCTLQFDDEDSLAMTVCRKMKRSFLGAVSIKASIDPSRARIGDDDILIFGKSELIGLDVVGRGSNPSSVVTARELGLDDEALEQIKQRAQDSGEDPEPSLKEVVLKLENIEAKLDRLLEQGDEPGDEAGEDEERSYLTSLLQQINRG